MNRWIRVIVLMAIAAYCAYGFAATFEPLESGTPWVWRIGYGLVGVICFTGALSRIRRS
jgi:hypothetical protein